MQQDVYWEGAMPSSLCTGILHLCSTAAVIEDCCCTLLRQQNIFFTKPKCNLRNYFFFILDREGDCCIGIKWCTQLNSMRKGNKVQREISRNINRNNSSSVLPFQIPRHRWKQPRDHQATTAGYFFKEPTAHGISQIHFWRQQGRKGEKKKSLALPRFLPHVLQ